MSSVSNSVYQWTVDTVSTIKYSLREGQASSIRMGAPQAIAVIQMIVIVLIELIYYSIYFCNKASAHLF